MSEGRLGHVTQASHIDQPINAGTAGTSILTEIHPVLLRARPVISARSPTTSCAVADSEGGKVEQ